MNVSVHTYKLFVGNRRPGNDYAVFSLIQNIVRYKSQEAVHNTVLLLYNSRHAHLRLLFLVQLSPSGWEMANFLEGHCARM